MRVLVTGPGRSNTNSTKQRLIDATADSMRRRGVAATSFTDVLRAAGAPRGVIYHHFPGGKQELAEAAVTSTGVRVAERFTTITQDATSAQELVRAFAALVRPIVLESVAGAGCAVAAAVTASEADSGAAAAAAKALELWRHEIARGLAAAGKPKQSARDLASLLLAMLEGSYILCRAQSSIEPFDAAIRELTELL